MSESTHSVEFKDSQEQLQLSAMINRFCDRKSNEFDPTLHVDEARKIAKALSPRIKLFSSESFSWKVGSSSSPSKSAQLVGATDLGEASATIEDKREKELKQKTIIGEQNTYRIGSYSATKVRLSTNLGEAVALRFKHWLKHGPANIVMDKLPPFWEIIYLAKNLEPIGISEIHTVTISKRESKIIPDLIIHNQRLDRQFVWCDARFTRYDKPIREKLAKFMVGIRKKTRI